MNNNIAIKVENLSKCYRIGSKEKRTNTLIGAFTSWVKSPFSNFRQLQKLSKFGEEENGEDIIWALKNVSFEVKHGEVMGIIGRNGAGKSTLLKILSRITKPTTGKIVLNGRVSSLLEVGTGFHPELTGRENIYLNGTILGMSKAEINRKFDQIIEFSGVEKFLDTPVKHYSSGMRVRLAFSVAAHLEPEILIIDEVLAVGDIEFQRKCMGRMGDVAKQGRTILFVSHNLGAMSALCSKAILLDNGKKILDDDVGVTVERYLATSKEKTEVQLIDRIDREGTGDVRFIETWIEDKNGNRVDTVWSGQEVSIVAIYHIIDGKKILNPHLAFALRDSIGNPITDLWNESAGYHWEEISTNGKVRCTLPRLPLNAGIYYYSICCIVNGITIDWIRDAGKFRVELGNFFGTGKLPKTEHGNYLLDQKWAIDTLAEKC